MLTATSAMHEPNKSITDSVVSFSSASTRRDRAGDVRKKQRVRQKRGSGLVMTVNLQGANSSMVDNGIAMLVVPV